MRYAFRNYHTYPVINGEAIPALFSLFLFLFITSLFPFIIAFSGGRWSNTIQYIFYSMVPDNPATRACLHMLTFILGLIAPIAFSYALYYVWTGESAIIYHILITNLPSSFTHHAALLTCLIHYWLAAEVIFFSNFWNSRRILQQTCPAIRTSKAERTALFWNCVHTIQNVEEWICGWFYIDDGNNTRPPFEQIRQGNVETWYV